jgi:ADP-heptose:LPS heptosyltransferase
VKLETRRTWLQPNAKAIFEAEEFLRQYGLTRGTFLTASLGDGTGRHWPNSNLMKLAQQLDTPTIVFGKKGDPEIPGTIACIEKPFQVIAALIRWSYFYLGPASGISWLATTTDTPVAVIFDPLQQDPAKSGFREALRGERDDIQEWDIYTGLQTVLAHVESKLDRVNSGLVVTPASS